MTEKQDKRPTDDEAFKALCLASLIFGSKTMDAFEEGFENLLERRDIKQNTGPLPE